MMWNVARGAAAAVLAVALMNCGEGNNRTSDENMTPEGQTALSEAALSTPVLGAFLADCSEQGTSFLVKFIQVNPLEPAIGGEPGITLADALVDENDALTLPILAGVGEEGPLSAEAAQGMLPGGVPADTPVLGVAPITCEDGLTPAELTQVVDYNATIGAIPVFGETLVGETVQTQGVILAIVGDFNSTNPLGVGTNPLPVDLTNFGIPNGDLSLLDGLADLITSILTLAP